MSKYSQNVIHILYQHQLEYVSGQYIAEQLNISRTSVKKIIDQLKNEGCDIESINHRGHRLITLPDKWYEGIVMPLIQEQSLFNNIEVHESINSTQLQAKQQLVGNKESFLILSDEQTQGKGRFNRPWTSAKSKGLWMSIVLRPEVAFSMITKFNLFMALGIRDAIQQFSNDEVKVKWPNDIYIEGRKVCGFLTEMVANSDGIEAVICGIGINMNHHAEDFVDELKHKATSIALHSDDKINRYQFLKSLITNIEYRYAQFNTKPFEAIRDEYIEASNIWNKELRFTENNIQFNGKAVDIDNDGFLIVKDNTGETKKLMSADIEI